MRESDSRGASQIVPALEGVNETRRGHSHRRQGKNNAEEAIDRQDHEGEETQEQFQFVHWLGSGEHLWH
jgi:hypothetical protein